MTTILDDPYRMTFYNYTPSSISVLFYKITGDFRRQGWPCDRLGYYQEGVATLCPVCWQTQSLQSRLEVYTHRKADTTQFTIVLSCVSRQHDSTAIFTKLGMLDEVREAERQALSEAGAHLEKWNAEQAARAAAEAEWRRREETERPAREAKEAAELAERAELERLQEEREIEEMDRQRGIVSLSDLDEVDLDSPPEWMFDQLIEVGQFAMIYGPKKTGKSLLALDYACQLAKAGKWVLYIDRENSPLEAKRRMKSLGYTAKDLGSLDYRTAADIGWLDTEEGAAAFIELVELVNPDVIILDTWSKFIGGEEASPTTHTRAYVLAIAPVVRGMGVTVVTIDHTGKDINRGPRGGSTKSDNIDVSWLLTTKASTTPGARQLRLERKDSRTGRGPDVVELTCLLEPTRHVKADQKDIVLTAEERACIAKLDELEVPAAWGRDRVSEVLKANAYKVRAATLSKAIKVRKERGGASAESLNLFPEQREQVQIEDPGTGREQVAERSTEPQMNLYIPVPGTVRNSTATAYQADCSPPPLSRREQVRQPG